MTGLRAALILLGIPFGASFLVTAGTLPSFIKFLKERQIQQYLREEGPKSHAHKAKTPTAGGVCFILAFLVIVVGAWLNNMPTAGSAESLAVIAVGVICGLIGFLDDFAKIQKKNNAGLPAKVRLLSELALGAILGGVLCYLFETDYAPLYLWGLHPSHWFHIPMPLFVLFSSFVVGATSNAVNLTDGIDGLAAGTSFLVFGTMTLMFLALGQLPLAFIAVTACGAMLGFLLFNKNPAKIFMGDTGSLFIGGLMAALVLASGTALYFIPLSLIFVAEAVSVMSQVTYFKLTKPYTPEKPMSPIALAIYKMRHKLPGEGKRLLRMAPLHHHFEAVYAEKGVKEWQVVAGFWAVQAVLCAIVLAIFFGLDALLCHRASLTSSPIRLETRI